MDRVTINQMVQNTIQQYGSKTALSHKVDKKYQDISYATLAERIKDFCLGLTELGLQKGDRVALLSENRPEWAITDLATLAGGGVTVPMFSTLTSAQVEYIVRDSGAKILCVSSERQLQKIKDWDANVPTNLQHIVIFDDLQDDSVYQQASDAVGPDDLASIIYTSGTTGDPKGAMLTHSNFMSNAQAAMRIVSITPDDVFLSFLPLSHVFERMGGHYLPLSGGATIAYAESLFTIRQDMQEVRPTIMMSVPRLYEGMHERIIRSVKEGSSTKQKIFHWSVGVGAKVSQAIQRKRKPNPILSLKASIANKLVFQKLKAVTGGRLRFFVSGGAPLSKAIAEFFHAAGILILEGYGLTETSPVISVNQPDRWKFGTVGPIVPGVEVKIAEDGEILSRGPHIMQGYFNKPSDTAEAIDADGWFHTGDIGEIDEEGFLAITDRKKNILVLSNGKNVAPQPIENQLKQSPYISEIMLLGDQHKSVAALIVPSLDEIKEYAKEQQLETGDMAALLQTQEIQRLIRGEINQYSSDLADFERVRMFTLMAEEFSEKSGEMTPTLKLKRSVVMENHKAAIDQMYGDDG
ncbi:Putative long-chain-fatty-acid--CoA ligase [Geodia barretti]|uniref:long-chain-fatty-acid--CoA ligase n=1 Tax=Geodia barretti TaxID=519541 RepID=A0AA35R4C6_GEOBA|nr:Putative long-chain-fatty-acid--CoA ligase [Geodia barretti]